jgi:hypothetical protein
MKNAIRSGLTVFAIDSKDQYQSPESKKITYNEWW